MKLPIQNLSYKTHISLDFRLAYGNLNNYIESIEEGDSPRSRHLAKRTFLHRNILHYEEYFSQEKYENVITDDNRQDIERMNQLVDQLNECRKKEITDYSVLSPLRNALDEIITGGL